VTGISEFAVGVLNRIGVMKLYPSKRRVLEYLRVKGQDDNDDDYNRVIISPHPAGKSTLLAFGAFIAIMSSFIPYQPASGLEPLVSVIEQPPTSGAEPSADALDQSASGVEQSPTSSVEHSAPDLDQPAVEQSPSPRPIGQNSFFPCKPRVLIVCPTHETAKEIGKFLGLLLELHGHNCATLVGGDTILADITALRKWPTAVVGTPGRLLDHIKNERLNLSQIIYCAVDEVDTSAKNPSFREFFDVMNTNLPECQVIAVSSRMTLDVVAPVKALLKPNSPSPTIIRMGRNPEELIRTEEVWARLSIEEFNSFPRWLHEHPPPEQYRRERAIIFVETRKGVETFYKMYVEYLKSLNIEDVDGNVRYTYGGRREAEREATLEDFCEGKFAILFTTHLLAKGVNIPNVNVAYHVHPIRDVSTYREASARVGRGDNKAYVCTLFGEEDEELVDTYKTSFKSVNGSSLVIEGENIESNNIPIVTGADILHALDDDDYN
jgi:superfamily II DNA/RNA helicase